VLQGRFEDDHVSSSTTVAMVSQAIRYVELGTPEEIQAFYANLGLVDEEVGIKSSEAVARTP
jgi:hypothetical protein